MDGPVPPRVTFPWLRPEHVQWLLSPVLHLVVGAFVLVGLGLLVTGAAPLPHYRDLLWSDHNALVLLGNAALGWTMLGIHELAHLATARAAGVPGRIGFGTRLQFLVAQTDISGIWTAPRRHRLAAYTAGMALEAVLASIALIISAATGNTGPAHQLAMVMVLMTALQLGWQLLIFMRTDVYFVVQDLSGCRNLYGDGLAYVRALTRLTRPRPVPGQSPREHRTVQVYSAILVPGIAVCLALAVLITVPLQIELIRRGASGIASGTPGGVFDGAVTIALLGGVQFLWARSWWRRHGHRVSRWRGFRCSRRQTQ